MKKFRYNNPQTKHEKLIVELTDNLMATMIGFIKLNNFTTLDNSLFNIIKDGSLAYYSSVLDLLISMMLDKDEISKFIKESHDFFNQYLEQIRKNHINP